jgi:hypothetical protein
MTNDETMTKNRSSPSYGAARQANDEIIREYSNDETGFGLCYSFVIRHSCFVIFLFELTAVQRSDSLVPMRWIALIGLVLLVGAANSCTTLVTRRDLYSPEPGADSFEAKKQWASTTTTTTTTEMRPNPAEEAPALVPPQFR